MNLSSNLMENLLTISCYKIKSDVRFQLIFFLKIIKFNNFLEKYKKTFKKCITIIKVTLTSSITKYINRSINCLIFLIEIEQLNISNLDILQ